MQDARFSRTCLLSLYESEANTNEVKEVPAEAAESMLNYIYSGKVPILLKCTYLLDHLKESCVKSLIERLEVSSCISTFIMADWMVVT